MVIQGTVVSAEHVAKTTEPLNLKKFIREFDLPVIVGGCASYQAALHLMRTGAVGILVGVGPGNACTPRGVPGVGARRAPAIAEPRGARIRTEIRGSLQEIVVGPAHENDGRLNLFGALRTSMATCGYETVKEFQKAEVMIAPALKTEGKDLQRAQNIGMGK